MPPGLARRLRDETQALHTAAERSGAMRALLRGRMDGPTYARLLRDLHAIYDALERGIARHATRPALVPAARPGLARAGRLARDLDAIAGAGWAASLAPAPAARAYANRLTALADAAPDLLVAHAYVRYMGDLSGGQHVARAVRRSLGLDGERGAAFYEFPGVPDAEAFKAEFRAALDALPAEGVDPDQVVEEAKWAFAAHADLFAELSVPLPLGDPGGARQDGAVDDEAVGGGAGARRAE